MKNLLTVPVSYPKLLGGKLIVTIFLSILFGIYSVAITVLTGTLAGLDGLSAAVLLRQGVQLVAAAFNTSLVCMPMILIFGQTRGAYLGGSLLTFFLGWENSNIAIVRTSTATMPTTASKTLGACVAPLYSCISKPARISAAENG